MHGQVRSHEKAANHQLPIAAAFWINGIVSMEECSRLMKNLMQIHCSTHLIMLNVTATQYTCSLNSVYHPHWLVQWSCHCSHMYIPVHYPWPSGHIDVAQTILIMLTMAGLLLDRTLLLYIYTVHMLTQWCLPPPLSSTVKLSLFTQAHFSSLLFGCQVTYMPHKLFSLY